MLLRVLFDRPEGRLVLSRNRFAASFAAASLCLLGSLARLTCAPMNLLAAHAARARERSARAEMFIKPTAATNLLREQADSFEVLLRRRQRMHCYGGSARNAAASVAAAVPADVNYWLQRSRASDIKIETHFMLRERV